MGSQLQRAEEAAKRVLVMQAEGIEGSAHSRLQTKRLLNPDRLLGLEMEVSRLEALNREYHAKLLRHAHCSRFQHPLPLASPRLNPSLFHPTLQETEGVCGLEGQGGGGKGARKPVPQRSAPGQRQAGQGGAQEQHSAGPGRGGGAAIRVRQARAA